MFIEWINEPQAVYASEKQRVGRNENTKKPEDMAQLGYVVVY